MAHLGQTAAEYRPTASLTGGWTPYRGVWLARAVIVVAALFSILAAIAGRREERSAGLSEGRSTTNAGTAVGSASSAPSSGIQGAGLTAAAASPTTVASSWSVGPIVAPPATAPAPAPATLRLAQEAGKKYGVNIILEGQDWGADEGQQTANVGAVISAIDILPVRVSSSVVAGANGPLAILSNKQGRTAGGWQPYGDSPSSFYTNSDQGLSGYHAANEIVISTGADEIMVAHELLHAYQFGATAPGDYTLALLGDEMRSFMAATGWQQLVSDDEVKAAAHEPWDEINSLFAYIGRPLTYKDGSGATATLEATNPLEAFAATGALYYAHRTGTGLPDWPEYGLWFDEHLG